MYSVLPCEEEFLATGRHSYAYFLASKRRFADAELVHRFQVKWPWPSHKESVLDNGSGRGNRRKREGPHGDIKEEEEEEEEPSATANAGPSFPTSALASRRYGRPTTIVGLSSDPHASERSEHGEPVYDGYNRQRVAMLLSSGDRLRLPLLAADDDEEEEAPFRGERIPRQYWRAVGEPPRGSSPRRHHHHHRVLTELVIGELSSIEWLMETWHRCTTSTRSRAYRGDGSPFRDCIDLSVSPSLPAETPGAAAAAAAAREVEGGGDGDLSPPHNDSNTTAARGAPPFRAWPARRPSQLPVFCFLMHSIPLRVLWLSSVADKLLLSLPCEERIVTLHAPPAATPSPNGGGGKRSPALDGYAYTPGQSTPVPLRESHSFALPRGVIPLDIVEVLQRPFIAVGTHEHGVLLCWLDVHTGAVESIAQWVSLSAVGSALFPVTRMAAVFAPVWSFPQNLRWPKTCGLWTMDGHGGGAALSSSAKERFLSSLMDGVLVCCSPYDLPSVVLKNLGTSSASSVVLEYSSSAKSLDPLLSVAPCVDADVGVLGVTAQGIVTQMQCFVEESQQERCRTARRKRREHATAGARDAGNEAEEDESTDGKGGVAQDDLGLDNAALATKLRCACTSERIAPTLLRNSLVRCPARLLRLGDTAPVFQLRPTKRERAVTKHFMLAATAQNTVVLLDRANTAYKVLSTFQLRRCVSPSRGGTGAVKVEAAATSTPCDEEGPATPTRDDAAPRDHLEDLCCGIVFLSAGHQRLTVAAAHHGNTVSILSYQGAKEELGLLKRAYEKS